MRSHKKYFSIIFFLFLMVSWQNCDAAKRTKTILLVSGWQDVNIGDIAHTPGLIHVLKTYVPDANIILWEKSKSDNVDNLIRKHYPDVKILHGKVDKNSDTDNPEIYNAFEQADIMIHGSGPYVVGQPHLEAWVKHAGDKPFGIFGVTIEKMDDRLKNLLLKASFIYTRETQSLNFLKKAGLCGDHISFAPDATFFLNIRDDLKAIEFIYENQLKSGKFICVIPRLRLTPYYNIANRHLWSEKRIAEVEYHNNSFKEEDHVKLREAIVAWVRKTGNKVLICPEMTYQVDIMDELLYDPLPEDVKPYVIRRGYWMTDEAASVYARSFAVLSFDCHSPIIASANEIPFFYLRQPEDTSKGQMYYDLNFRDWIFEIEEVTGTDITERLFHVRKNYKKAKNRIKKEQKVIAEIYKNACLVINELLAK